MTTRSQTANPAVKRSTTSTAAKRAATPAAGKTVRNLARLNHMKNVETGQFISWYKMGFVDRIRTIRSGVPAQRVGELSSVMDMPKEALMDSLGLSRATVNRKVQRKEMLSPEESERVMGMQALIGQVQAMIDADSAPDFDAAKWLASWIAAPLPALGGATPASFMDTVEGQKHIGNLLDMAQSGAYA
ncbi:antitoxin Xre-like helix-turn-helix domain-containing protein [Noviherbaspirillum pedocola]|nr:antitoxin Xre-like helix-turn-helix domain-containing protein [Noviherbaspirillum pedocola]